LPDTYEPAEPLAHRAKLLLKVDLDSLGQGTSLDIKHFQKIMLSYWIHNWQNFEILTQTVIKLFNLKSSLRGSGSVMALYGTASPPSLSS